jgi:hypothetical protein
MSTACQQHFEAMCSEFEKILPGISICPWDQTRAMLRYQTASHGEKLVLAFLLGVWNPETKWKTVKRFDLFEAGHTLSLEALGIIARWTANPRFP